MDWLLPGVRLESQDRESGSNPHYRKPSGCPKSSFVTAKMAATHQKYLLQKLRVLFIELSVLIFIMICRQERQEKECYSIHLANLIHADIPGYQNFVRMIPAFFYLTEELIHYRIKKSVSNFSKLLDVGLKLVITPRHLATGETYTSLQYHWLIVQTTICKFVSQVGRAVLAGFQDEYLCCPTDREDCKNVEEKIEDGTLGFPPPEPLGEGGPNLHYFLLGDDAFALMPWIVKRYSRRQLTREERIATYRISRGRRVMVNAFGILVNRFMVLLGTNPSKWCSGPAEWTGGVCTSWQLQESFEGGQTSARPTERLLQSLGGIRWARG